MIVNYIVKESTSKTQLEDMVLQAITNRWTPLGGVSICYAGDNEVVYSQAMIMETDD